MVPSVNANPIYATVQRRSAARDWRIISFICSFVRSFESDNKAHTDVIKTYM